MRGRIQRPQIRQSSKITRTPLKVNLQEKLSFMENSPNTEQRRLSRYCSSH